MIPDTPGSPPSWIPFLFKSFQTKSPKLATFGFIPKSKVVLFSPGASVTDAVTPVDGLPSLSALSSKPTFWVVGVYPAGMLAVLNWTA